MDEKKNTILEKYKTFSQTHSLEQTIGVTQFLVDCGILPAEYTLTIGFKPLPVEGESEDNG